MAITWRLTSRLALLMLVGLVCCGVAIAGLCIFAVSEWLTFHDFPYPTGWEGYTKGEFTGLILFVFFTPVSFAFLFTVAQYLMRISASKSIRFHTFIIFYVALQLGGLIGFGISWASDFMKCMGVGCVDDSKFKPYDPQRPEAGIGFQNVIGITVYYEPLVSCLQACRFSSA